MLQLRDHTFLGTTQSLCPECLALVPAKIVVRPNRRVYFRKHCPTHGIREDFVCSDVRWYDRTEFLVPGKVPAQFGTEPDKGCPYDCGLCTEHEQHTCIALAEITSGCNLQCPMCFASSGPGGRHWTFEEACRAIDRVVAVETRPEVLQLSGGEPTLHPQFEQIFEYACAKPIDYVMINTNGIRLANDFALVERIARLKHRAEIYLQFDGLHDGVNRALRGESLLATKLRAIDNLGRVGLHTTLVCTLQPDVNFDQLGPLVEFAAQRPWISGLSLQPATYSGRHVLPEQLERRITFPDVVKGLVAQTSGLFAEDDFLPLPCAHPNCHTLTYAFRAGSRLIPLTRFINPSDSIDLLANGITFTRPKARELIEKYLGRLGCCAGGNCGPAGDEAGAGERGGADAGGRVTLTDLPVLRAGDEAGGDPELEEAARVFFTKALSEQLSPRDVFRITITSFLDAYNFDLRRLMKCCVHHTLPSGHIIPFCAYNVLYREGHVALPTLLQATEAARSATVAASSDATATAAAGAAQSSGTGATAGTASSHTLPVIPPQ